MDISREIKQWLDAGAKDFDKGFDLLRSISRNPFFMNNILRRHDLAKVKHELNKMYLRGGVKVVQTKQVSVAVIPGKDRSLLPVKDIVETEKTKEEVADPVPVSKKISSEEFLTDRVILRKEFAFLNEDSCPDELKVLVANMITAHAKYIKAHERLFDVANKENDVCFGVVSELVENYIDNRNMWAELEHYKKTGMVLGAHRIFAERKRREEIMKMGFDDLKLLRSNLQRRIAYKKRQIKEHGDDDRILEWKKDIEALEREKKLAGTPRKKKMFRKAKGMNK